MGVPSSIDTLPPDILERLQALLRDPRVTQLEATRRINMILAEQQADPISASAVNRYSRRMEKAGARLRQSREIADMWIAKLGAGPQGKLGQLVNEILRTFSFDLALILQDGQIDMENAPEAAKMLKNMAIAMERLERAASENLKRVEEIRRQALEEAAETVTETARAQGLDENGVRMWRDTLMSVI